MAVRQFIGARYLVKFDGEWSQDNAYEAITAVTHNAYTYLSKQPVPANVDISNTDFWLLWADPNAQMEELRQTVEGYLATVDGIADEIGAGFDSVNTIAKAISDEIAARTAADADLQDQIGSGFDSVNTIAKAISDEIAARTAADTDLESKIEESDIQVFTGAANESPDVTADWILVKMKRSAIELGVCNNNDNYTHPYEGTSNPLAWLNANPGYILAHNCAFSGGETSATILANHYDMRYDGTNYPATPTAPAKRPFIGFDSSTGDLAYFAADVALGDVPVKYDYVFTSSEIIIENSVPIAAAQLETGYDSTRSVIGWSDDYYWFFASEGRNMYNKGLGLVDIANLLYYGFDVPNAVNLDGGASCMLALSNGSTAEKINGYRIIHSALGNERVTSLNMHYRKKA